MNSANRYRRIGARDRCRSRGMSCESPHCGAQFVISREARAPDRSGSHGRLEQTQTNGGVMTTFRNLLIGSALLAATAAANAATDYPTGYTKCAKEGETCSFSGTRSVAYGKSGTFVYATLTGPITCSAFAVPVDQRRQPALLLVWRVPVVELEQQLDFEQQLVSSARARAARLRAAAAAVAASPARPAHRAAARRSPRRFA